MNKLPAKSRNKIANIVHVISGLHPKAGGPSRSVTQLVDALADNGEFGIGLISQARSGEPSFSPSNADVAFRLSKSAYKLPLIFGIPAARELLQCIKEKVPAIVHSHGIWSPLYHLVARIARNRGIPLVLHPHGMLEKWALEHRSFKKKVALSLYQRGDLDATALFIATAPQEAESIRRLGLRKPIAIIPNGIKFPRDAGDRVVGSRQPPDVRNVVFMSRIHPKKGLLNLIDAWANVRPPGCRLLLAGPDEGGHLSSVLSRVNDLRLNSSVQYVGEISDDQKPEFFGQADLFILPTFSENFGIVIAEALSFGVPVITTHGAPWEGLRAHDCGWWVEPTASGLAGALRQALSMDPDSLRMMGQRGKLYSRDFAWPTFAQETNDVYRWLLGLCDRPGCVLVD